MAFRFRPTDVNLDGDGAKRKVAAFDKAIEKCANAFMAKHIQQWYRESLSNPYNKLQFVYKRALEAIIHHPQRILRIRDVTKIKGIGDVMAKRLDEVVKAEIGKDTADEEEVAKFLRGQPGDFAVAEVVPTAPTRKTTSAGTKKKRDYIPAYRSGPYAMLIALLLEKQRPNSKGHLLKDEICPLGQPYCSVVMDEGTFSALSGAIKTLVEKELVQKWGTPAKFALTELGAELALKLWDSGERRSSMPDPIKRRADEEVVEPPKFLPGSSEFQPCCWSAHSYDIVLLVDVREVRSRDDRDFIIERLCQSGIKAEQRNLDLGDFLFVARLKQSHRQGDSLDSEEVVLDLVIERKREDDLLSSIPDGRFMEQKYRLIHSGITKLIYLVEEIERLEFGGIRREQFIAALIQTQVTDGLFLKYTVCLEDTIKFLVTLYQQLPLVNYAAFLLRINRCTLEPPNIRWIGVVI